MTLHKHSNTKDNRVLLYERRYEGEGKYHQRGICPNIVAGDEWASYTEPKTVLQVVSIESVSDSQAKWDDPAYAKDSLFSGTFYDPNFVAHGKNYKVLRTV